VSSLPSDEAEQRKLAQRVGAKDLDAFGEQYPRSARDHPRGVRALHAITALEQAEGFEELLQQPKADRAAQ
jgi:hypothetical protein